MNTNDFNGNKYMMIINWPFLFSQQKKIFKRFMKIEGIDWNTHDFSIDCLEDQEIFKDFLLTRTVEELVEATTDLEHKDHFLEEIIDSLNFLLESYILYGWTYKDLPAWEECDCRIFLFDAFKKSWLNDHIYRVVEKIGLTTNLLKNRKWKHSQYLVDLIIFEKRFKEVWKEFNNLCNFLGIHHFLIFKIWTQKYLCNKFRIRSKY